MSSRTLRVCAASALPGTGVRVHSNRTTAPPSPCASRRVTCQRAGGAAGGSMRALDGGVRDKAGVSMRGPMMILEHSVSAVTQRWYLHAAVGSWRAARGEAARD